MRQTERKKQIFHNFELKFFLKNQIPGAWAETPAAKATTKTRAIVKDFILKKCKIFFNEKKNDRQNVQFEFQIQT